jgi:hypothetical protein
MLEAVRSLRRKQESWVEQTILPLFQQADAGRWQSLQTSDIASIQRLFGSVLFSHPARDARIIVMEIVSCQGYRLRDYTNPVLGQRCHHSAGNEAHSSLSGEEAGYRSADLKSTYRQAIVVTTFRNQTRNISDSRDYSSGIPNRSVLAHELLFFSRVTRSATNPFAEKDDPKKLGSRNQPKENS